MPPALRHLVTLGSALAVYFAFPTERLPSVWSTVVSIVGLVGGGAVLAVLIVGQLRRQLRAESDEGVRIQSLLVLIYLSVLLFALGYYVLAQSDDGQFAGLATKTDALYFTMTTVATVGLGDVHPTGQLARGIVTAHIVFNLVFLGLLVTMLTSQLRQRATTARSTHNPG